MSTNLEDLILRDTRANQPAAGIPGRLYYVTDENVTERDNGSTWDDYSDASALDIDSLTEETTPASGDMFVMERSGTLYKVDSDNLPGGGGGGGTSLVQVTPDPTTFSGDTIDGSSATPFVDVAAFDTKDVLNSRVLHLKTLGASKDHRVRVTLGTTKAGAFTVRVALAVSHSFWASPTGDNYTEIRLSTAADAQLFICQIMAVQVSSLQTQAKIFFGGSGSIDTTGYYIPFVKIGEKFTLQFVRDGSNVITPTIGHGQAPFVYVPALESTNNTPYTQTVSGTLARLEIAHHTPSGPSGSDDWLETWIDYVDSQ